MVLFLEASDGAPPPLQRDAPTASARARSIGERRHRRRARAPEGDPQDGGSHPRHVEPDRARAARHLHAHVRENGGARAEMVVNLVSFGYKHCRPSTTARPRLSPMSSGTLCHPVRAGRDMEWCRKRDSTPDPVITNDVLYQLSYCGGIRRFVVGQTPAKARRTVNRALRQSRQGGREPDTRARLDSVASGSGPPSSRTRAPATSGDGGVGATPSHERSVLENRRVPVGARLRQRLLPAVDRVPDRRAP